MVTFLYLMIHLWLWIVQPYRSGTDMSIFDMLTKPFNPNTNENKLNDRQIETINAINQVNELFEKHGYGDISDFMTGIAATETQLGKLTSDVSYSPFQIDPIRYEDIVSRTKDDPSTPNVIEGGAALNRANIANEFLKEMGFAEDFDILSLFENMDEIRNPLIGSLLTRMGLANLPESAGDFTTKDINKQAEYWKAYWNSSAGKGTTQHYINEKNYFNSLLNQKAYDDTPLED